MYFCLDPAQTRRQLVNLVIKLNFSKLRLLKDISTTDRIVTVHSFSIEPHFKLFFLIALKYFSMAEKPKYIIQLSKSAKLPIVYFLTEKDSQSSNEVILSMWKHSKKASLLATGHLIWVGLTGLFEVMLQIRMFQNLSVYCWSMYMMKMLDKLSWAEPAGVLLLRDWSLSPMFWTEGR